MMMKLKFFKKNCFLFLLLSLFKLYSYEKTFEKNIDDLLQKFARPITALEIGFQDSNYIVQAAKNSKFTSTYIALLLDDATQYCQKITNHNLVNVAVLNPKKITTKQFSVLSHCEHFDVVIVTDIFQCPKIRFFDCLDSILSLGEHIFFEVDADNTDLINVLQKKDCTIIASHEKKFLLYRYYKKNMLTLHRWDERDIPYDNGKQYYIHSTFIEKFLIKIKSKKTSLWQPGINLKTFIMLYGTYPTDQTISKEIASMRYSAPKHSDLCVGNMVIQGSKVIPIDIDTSGNEKEVENYIKIANSCIFNGSNVRLSSPKESLKCYSNLMHELIRKPLRSEDNF
jgi:hypothetical protein